MNQTPNLRLQSALINEFYLTPQNSKHLDRYFLQEWTGVYLSSRLSIHGTIIHQDVEYICVLPECLRETFFKAQSVKLSFRKPKAGMGNPYVLIRFGAK